METSDAVYKTVSLPSSRTVLSEGPSSNKSWVRSSPTVESKFLDRVIRVRSGCWEWQGFRNPRGYGKITIYRIGTIAAHRLSFNLFCGPIPCGMFVLHRCDNPPCCNPTHLFLGTHIENMRDRDEKGRTLRGASLPQTKLTEIQRDEIRRHYRWHIPGATIPALARKYGVGVGTIHRVLNHKTH